MTTGNVSGERIASVLEDLELIMLSPMLDPLSEEDKKALFLIEPKLANVPREEIEPSIDERKKYRCQRKLFQAAEKNKG